MNDSEPSLTTAAIAVPLATVAFFPAFEVAFAQSATAQVALSALALFGSALFSFTRVSLMRSVPDRVLGPVPEGTRRALLERHLTDVEPLVTSAGVLRVSCDLAFVLLVLGLAAGGEPLSASSLGLAAAIGIPLLALAVEVLPQALVETRGDGLLRRFLGTFHVLQLPIAPLSRLLARLRRYTSRRSGARTSTDATRRIVENLREAVNDSDLETELDEREREIIENVMEFHDVDVAAIMTPRTEIQAVDVASDLRSAIAAASGCGHGRLPVYRGSLDEIVGVFSARDVLVPVAERRLDEVTLESLIRPTLFVPETKRVSELLEELRRQRTKIAIVVDEYGGTAGLVTMSDVLAELVGDIQDEFDDAEDEAEIVRMGEFSAEVLASVRVSEVNEELEIELPEEGDYETLGGFVLAELGRFPIQGEVVAHGEVRLTVIDANERRVLKLGVQWNQPDVA